MDNAYYTQKVRIFFAVFITVIGIGFRFIPHAWNATPVSAIGLWIGSYIGISYGISAVLAVMVVSDFFIGFYDWRIMLAVYGSFAVSALLGRLVQRRNVFSIAAASLSSSVLFFIVTNGAVWLFGSLYNHTLAGLFECYVVALPFFKNMLLGDIYYVSLFFGGYALIRYCFLGLRHLSLTYQKQP